MADPIGYALWWQPDESGTNTYFGQMRPALPELAADATPADQRLYSRLQDLYNNPGTDASQLLDEVRFGDLAPGRLQGGERYKDPNILAFLGAQDENARRKDQESIFGDELGSALLIGALGGGIAGLGGLLGTGAAAGTEAAAGGTAGGLAEGGGLLSAEGGSGGIGAAGVGGSAIGAAGGAGADLGTLGAGAAGSASGGASTGLTAAQALNAAKNVSRLYSAGNLISTAASGGGGDVAAADASGTTTTPAASTDLASTDKSSGLDIASLLASLIGLGGSALSLSGDLSTSEQQQKLYDYLLKLFKDYSTNTSLYNTEAQQSYLKNLDAYTASTAEKTAARDAKTGIGGTLTDTDALNKRRDALYKGLASSTQDEILRGVQRDLAMRGQSDGGAASDATASAFARIIPRLEEDASQQSLSSLATALAAYTGPFTGEVPKPPAPLTAQTSAPAVPATGASGSTLSTLGSQVGTLASLLGLGATGSGLFSSGGGSDAAINSTLGTSGLGLDAASTGADAAPVAADVADKGFEILL